MQCVNERSMLDGKFKMIMLNTAEIYLSSSVAAPFRPSVAIIAGCRSNCGSMAVRRRNHLPLRQWAASGLCPMCRSPYDGIGSIVSIKRKSIMYAYFHNIGGESWACNTDEDPPGQPLDPAPDATVNADPAPDAAPNADPADPKQEAAPVADEQHKQSERNG